MRPLGSSGVVVLLAVLFHRHRLYGCLLLRCRLGWLLGLGRDWFFLDCLWHWLRLGWLLLILYAVTLLVVLHRFLVADALQIGKADIRLCAVAKCHGYVVAVSRHHGCILTSLQHNLLTRREAHSSLYLVHHRLHIPLTNIFYLGFLLLGGLYLAKCQDASVRSRVDNFTLVCGSVIDNNALVAVFRVNHRAILSHLHMTINDKHLFVVSLLVFLFQRGRMQRTISMLLLLQLLALLRRHIICILIDAVYNTGQRLLSIYIRQSLLFLLITPIVTRQHSLFCYCWTIIKNLKIFIRSK